MVFETKISFEPGTCRAVLWADTPAGARFKVLVDPQYAIELWGLRKPVELIEFVRAIKEHMDEITKAATAAYARGELVLQLD
jgi:hypothetical protein